MNVSLMAVSSSEDEQRARVGKLNTSAQGLDIKVCTGFEPQSVDRSIFR